jgi:hypothetical protein
MMAFTPKTKPLDSFIERTLDAYKSGDIDRDKATGIIAQVVVAAAIGNQPEFESYIRLSNEELFDD